MWFSFLLDGVPGITPRIPGVDIEYLPEQGMIAAAALYEKMHTNAYYLLAPALVVAFGVAILHFGEKWTVKDVLVRAALTLMLLNAIPYVFGTIMVLGNAAAQQILSKQDTQKLNAKFREASKKAQEERGINTSSGNAWYERLFDAISNTSSALVTDIFNCLASIIFFVSTIFIALIWRVFVIVLYVFAPIAVVLGVIPGWGTKILANWIGAVVQISAWQLWMAICAWFVNTSDQILFLSRPVADGNYTVSNHLESVALCFIFSVLYLATPFIIFGLLPVSRFSDSTAKGLLAGTYIVSNAMKSVVSAGTGAYGRVMSGGAAGG